MVLWSESALVGLLINIYQNIIHKFRMVPSGKTRSLSYVFIGKPPPPTTLNQEEKQESQGRGKDSGSGPSTYKQIKFLTCFAWRKFFNKGKISQLEQVCSLDPPSCKVAMIFVIGLHLLLEWESSTFQCQALKFLLLGHG